MVWHFTRLILITWPRRSLGKSPRGEVARTRRCDRSSSPAAAEPVGRARWCIMRYTGITGIIRITRITSIIRTYVWPREKQAWHDGFFFLRFPPRDSLPSPRSLPLPLPPQYLFLTLYIPRVPTRGITLSRIVTLPERPHLPLTLSSFPAVLLRRDSSYTPRLFSLFCYLFTLRPRASGRFNVRDFFSPARSSPFLSACPPALLPVPLPPSFLRSPLRSSRGRLHYARFARSNASSGLRRLCNHARGSPKFSLRLLRRKSFCSKFLSKSQFSWRIALTCTTIYFVIIFKTRYLRWLLRVIPQYVTFSEHIVIPFSIYSFIKSTFLLKDVEFTKDSAGEMRISRYILTIAINSNVTVYTNNCKDLQYRNRSADICMLYVS